MLPTLYTLTGNLLWERTLEFSAWSPGKTQRAKSESVQVGGKGINVSRMLTRLGAPTTALCFAGGSAGADCVSWLTTKDIAHHAFPSTAATRSGTVVRGGAQPETTFLGPDAAPDAAAWAACADYLDSLPDGQVLALCGSFPGWVAPAAEPLRRALARWAARGILTADTYGPPLDWALQQPLALVKINRDEFDALSPETERNQPVSSRLPAALASSRAHAWIVSDGGEPVWFADRSSPARQFAPPRIELLSPTGSGDVLFACLLYAHFQRGLPWPEALAYALPFAAANAACPGIAEFDLNNLPA
jgi:fructose-1-phosphate kinase PfkB-like protein